MPRLYFHSGISPPGGTREHTRRGRPAFVGEVRNVVLVLDLAENLLQHVFERNDARRAAEFVDHNGDVRTVLDKILQHQLQRHGHRARN